MDETKGHMKHEIANQTKARKNMEEMLELIGKREGSESRRLS